MNALVLAPQPFYSERGTPMSEENLLRVMSARGWTIDLLTYAEGEDIELPGLTIHRTPAVPGIDHVPPGFSIRKVVSDAVMTVTAFRMARTGAYDVVHALEESVFMAAAIRKTLGIPYVYDMDSILSEQLVDRFPVLQRVRGVLRYCEEIAVSGSLAVVAVCESLAEAARRLSPGSFVARLEDRTQLGPSRPGAESLREIAGPDRLIALYVGNLEHYQGIDLMLEGFARAAPRRPELSLVVIGGSEENVAHYRAVAGGLGLDGSVHLLGPRPVEHLRNYLEQADVLVSPRICGTNTPMKVYSFLDAGVPLLATRLQTHLQVLDDEVSFLFDPTPAGLAAALEEVAEDDEGRSRVAAAASERVARRHSRRAYEANANRLLARIETLAVRHGGRFRTGRLAGERSPVRRRGGSPASDTTRPSASDPRPVRPAARIPVPLLRA